MNRDTLRTIGAAIEGVADELEAACDAFADPLCPDELRQLVDELRTARSAVFDLLDDAGPGGCSIGLPPHMVNVHRGTARCTCGWSKTSAVTDRLTTEADWHVRQHRGER